MHSAFGSHVNGIHSVSRWSSRSEMSRRASRSRRNASVMTRAQIGVRPAVVSDADAIGDAHAESWLAAYAGIFDREFLVAAAESRRTGWRNLIDHLLAPPNVLRVGELEGHVVAFGHAAPSDEPSTVEVCGFYAHPAAWGSGVATALMQELLVVAGTGFDTSVLWTFRQPHGRVASTRKSDTPSPAANALKTSWTGRLARLSLGQRCNTPDHSTMSADRVCRGTYATRKPEPPAPNRRLRGCGSQRVF